jgi:uncharacterized membrane protein YdfJ with MMPL/SSD domain
MDLVGVEPTHLGLKARLAPPGQVRASHHRPVGAWARPRRTASRGILGSVFTERLARASASHPRRVGAAWLAVLVAAVALIATCLHGLSSSYHAVGQPESARAEAILTHAFPAGAGLASEASDAVVIHSSRYTASAPVFRAFLAGFIRTAAATPGVDQPIVSYLSAGSGLVSADGRATLISLSSPSAAQVKPLVALVRRYDRSPGFSVAITGSYPAQDDFSSLSQSDLEHGELAFGLPAALIVLVLVFGSIAAGLVPVAMALTSIIATCAAGSCRRRSRAPGRALVGGQTAKNADYFDAVTGPTPIVLAFVLGLSFLVLMGAFRSLTLALVSIALNLLSVGAAYGLLTLVFVHGVGASLLGFERSPTIEAWVPLFLFSVLFGLSMDYQVLLLSRIKERHDSGHDTEEAVATGVASTARIITGAALIIVLVFIGFARGQLVMFQQMGFGVAIALLLDATVIRVVILPSALSLLGDRSWYMPRLLRRKAAA